MHIPVAIAALTQRRWLVTWDIHADAERQLEDSGCNFTVPFATVCLLSRWNGNQLNRDVSDDWNLLYSSG